MADAKLVESYTALEQLWLAKATDEEKVQWFQRRAMSAEEANAELNAEKETAAIIVKYPDVEAADLVGLKTAAERENVAARIQAKVEKAKVVGQTTVEEAVKSALSVKDEEIVEIRKVYGKARQPQAGDVTGAGIAQTAAAAELGVGVQQKKPETVEDSIRNVADPMLRVLGLKK